MKTNGEVIFHNGRRAKVHAETEERPLILSAALQKAAGEFDAVRVRMQLDVLHEIYDIINKQDRLDSCWVVEVFTSPHRVLKLDSTEILHIRLQRDNRSNAYPIGTRQVRGQCITCSMEQLQCIPTRSKTSSLVHRALVRICFRDAESEYFATKKKI